MAQNIYDNQDFFNGYTKLPRQVEGLKRAPEWPALRSFIPNLDNSRFLDLGCGFGWVCRWARENGAVHVLGVDVSAKMLARAKQFPPDTNIRYVEADLDTLDVPQQFYDVVFSSLALHYLKDLKTLMGKVYQTLKPRGTFAFSVEHPIFTAPRNPKFIKDSEGRNIWPLDQYFDEGSRTTNWFADGVIKQHHTLASYVTLLLEAGFTLSAMIEWTPTAAEMEENPSWADEINRPSFLLIKATKPKS